MATNVDIVLDNDLLTEVETAEILRIRPGTLAVWRCARRYDLPWVKVGRSVRYRRQDVANFLLSRTERPAVIS